MSNPNAKIQVELPPIPEGGLTPSEKALRHKEYMRVYQREWRRKNRATDPEYRKAHAECEKTRYQNMSPEKKEMYKQRVKLWKYGLTIADYEVLFVEQNGVCAICETNQDTVDLAVDHCHETGDVRGLLCRKCNLGIGNLNDDPNLVRKALEYLEKSK